MTSAQDPNISVLVSLRIDPYISFPSGPELERALFRDSSLLFLTAFFCALFINAESINGYAITWVTSWFLAVSDTD
ncbi:MAG: hypothetical protein IJJ95_01815 [Spirochaetales bacterium]|nr:hypothetical protein [Spirochaetales bacterium]